MPRCGAVDTEPWQFLYFREGMANVCPCCTEEKVDE